MGWLSLRAARALPPVSRVTALLLAQPLNHHRDLQAVRSSTAIKPCLRIDPVGCDVGPRPGKVLIPAKQPRRTGRRHDLCRRAVSSPASYDHHDAGIQQLRGIKCFIIAGCVTRPLAQAGANFPGEEDPAGNPQRDGAMCSPYGGMSFPCGLLQRSLFSTKMLDLLQKCWSLSISLP